VDKKVLQDNSNKFYRNTKREGGCLLWLGGVDRDGYGSFQFRYKGVKYKIRAHRAAYLLHGGLLRDDVLRHTCDNVRCVNVEHLVTGTYADNVQDRVTRGRSAVGERHGRAKLTLVQVEDIRRLVGEGFSYTYLAGVYGVDRTTVRAAATGRTW
jgi:hypothetical protein